MATANNWRKDKDHLLRLARVTVGHYDALLRLLARRWLGMLLFAHTLAAVAAEPGPEAPVGEVVAVESGSELTVKLKPGEELAIQLADVEAPVPTQPAYAPATAALSRLVLHKRVRLRAVPNQPRRFRISVENVDVTVEMLTRGLVWVDRSHLNDRHLFTFEAQARAAKRGLWRDPHPLPPHEWRAGKRPESVRVADLSGLVIGDRAQHTYYPASCTTVAVPESQRLLFAREQDAKATGLRRRNCR